MQQHRLTLELGAFSLLRNLLLQVSSTYLPHEPIPVESINIEQSSSSSRSSSHPTRLDVINLIPLCVAVTCDCTRLHRPPTLHAEDVSRLTRHPGSIVIFIALCWRAAFDRNYGCLSRTRGPWVALGAQPRERAMSGFGTPSLENFQLTDRDNPIGLKFLGCVNF